MRVLQVCSAQGVGGGEIHVADLAAALVARGLQVEMAVRPASALPRLMGRAAAKVVWHRLPLRNALDLVSVRSLTRLLESRPFDVVHAHVARDYPIVALATNRGCRARLVLTRHHYLPIRGNAIYRRLLACATFIAVSESVRQTILKSLRLPAEQVTTIGNWIDVERYAALPPRQQARNALGITTTRVVGIIGQLTPLKGHEEFVRAAALLASKYSDVQFEVVGSATAAETAFEHRLRALVAESSLRDRLVFRGHVSDLPSLLAALDVVAVPSWNEAFSLVAAEAMAAGRPLVASRAGGLQELIEDGVTGLLVPPRDVPALAAGIERLLVDEQFAARLGAEARLRADAFAREPRIDAILELYGKRALHGPA
jgi:glycosyltransferase involved in cell wall biosynthesis